MVKSLMYQCSNSVCTSVQIKYVKSLSPLHISAQVTTIGTSKSLLQWCSNHYVWCSNISCTVFRLFYMPCVTAYVPCVKRYGICMGPAHILVFPLQTVYNACPRVSLWETLWHCIVLGEASEMMPASSRQASFLPNIWNHSCSNMRI